jgi:hypothetical protein
LRFIAIPPIANANGNSQLQTTSQPGHPPAPPSRPSIRPAQIAATSAVTPINTLPFPGTAVKEAERSIVSRMKRRFSIA